MAAHVFFWPFIDNNKLSKCLLVKWQQECQLWWLHRCERHVWWQQRGNLKSLTSLQGPQTSAWPQQFRSLPPLLLIGQDHRAASALCLWQKLLSFTQAQQARFKLWRPTMESKHVAVGPSRIPPTEAKETPAHMAAGTGFHVVIRNCGLLWRFIYSATSNKNISKT